MQKKSGQELEIGLGDSVMFRREDKSFEFGIVADFTDDSKKKAIIFPGYKTIETEKLQRITEAIIRVWADTVKMQRKKWNQKRYESSNE